LLNWKRTCTQRERCHAETGIAALTSMPPLVLQDTKSFKWFRALILPFCLYPWTWTSRMYIWHIVFLQNLVLCISNRQLSSKGAPIVSGLLQSQWLESLKQMLRLLLSAKSIKLQLT
jgi:hypothetical protein